MTRALIFATIVSAAAWAVPSLALEPVNRWSPDYNRAARAPRAADPYVHKPPVRIYRKITPAPKAQIKPLPRYGKPKPAIERIPET